MPEPRLIRRDNPTTVHGRPGAGAWRLHMPEDLLREASQRLRVVCLLAGGLWFVNSALDHVLAWQMGSTEHPWAQYWPTDSISIGAIVVSIALYLYARNSDRDPRRILDLGLVYMVLICLALGMIMHWEHVPANFPIFPLITWTGVTVLIFAGILPSSPIKMLIAGLLAVSMNPIGMLLAKARGTWDFHPWTQVLVMHYPDYLLVGVAVVISRVVTYLGMEVSRAREMGSYVLGDLIAMGGMGEVYRATHRMLARPAAIKLIRPEMLGAADGEAARLAIRRFHREAETAACLRSPHTVALYDFGVTEGETLYLAMELLEGMTLEMLVRRDGPVCAGRAIFLLRQVCDSLAEAHAHGLVHRDIKPANIHVGRVGLEHDFVKVLDFGLVKSIADRAAGPTMATAEGLTPGTPAYLPPEVAREEKIDGRSDLYALGCVAYYLLTGELVFEATSALQMIVKHMEEAPVAPSRRTVQPVPEALDRVVLACLAKSPADRPQTALALREALDAIEVEPWNEARAAQWWTAQATV